ncbi:MAG: ABC transporter substrate-binding protein [Actinobacteria bacterium]|nr:MAG: ABC transporter substrate-binding protein [Actinomycetota bacterium]
MSPLRRGAALAASLLVAAALAAGCVPRPPRETIAPPGSVASGTIEFWHFFSDREADAIQQAVDRFEAKFPQVKVVVRAGQDDDKTTQAIGAGQGPDVALSGTTDNVGKFCSTGAWRNLTPYLERDHVDLSDVPQLVQQYTTYEDRRCAMPLLADAYGLYYNKKLFAEAGIDAPPRTLTQLAYDAKQLTKRGTDGNLEQVGFDPLSGFYENSVAHFAVLTGARWMDEDGRSILGADPAWKTLLNWQKSMIDFYGYENIRKFQSTFGDEGSADNAFEKGQVAMNIDGEWRIASIAADEPADLDWGVAPLPVADNRPDLYGSGFVVGNVMGVARNSHNPEAAWQFVKFLSTDTDTVVSLANVIKNVPTLTSALRSPALTSDANFKIFLNISGNPKSSTSPLSANGTAYQDLAQAFVNDWQAGKVGNLDRGLRKLDDTINQALGE